MKGHMRIKTDTIRPSLEKECDNCGLSHTEEETNAELCTKIDNHTEEAAGGIVAPIIIGILVVSLIFQLIFFNMKYTRQKEIIVFLEEQVESFK